MKLTREDVVERLNDGDAGRDLSGSDLAGLDLSRLDLRGTNLSRADLSAADLRWAILEGADLHSSVLRRADCRWAVMRGANLRQADLGRANLSWADVTGADLTGAQIEGANLENVDLNDGFTEGGRRGRGFGGGAGGGRAVAIGGTSLTLPRSRVVVAAWIVGALALALVVWGWLYRRAFFNEFGIQDAELTKFLSTENLMAGLKVGLLTVKALLVTPFVLALLAALVVVVVIVPALLVLLGDRALKQSVSQRLRTPTTIALFAAYFLLAWAVLIPVVRRAGSWLLDQALPAENGLRATFTLATRSGVMAVGFLLLVCAAFYLGYLGWRLAAREVHGRDLPARWRLQYPKLNDAYAALRASRLTERSEPLAPTERRNGVAALAVLALLLPVLLASTGSVDAYNSMCDGGDLTRVQLFTERTPDSAPADSTICSRLVAETDEWVWIFFPSQTQRVATGTEAEAETAPTEVAEDGAAGSVQEVGGTTATAEPTSALPDNPRDYRHVVTVYKVARADVEAAYVGDADGGACATCADGATGEERYLIDPDEILIGGVVDAVTEGLVTLIDATTSVAAFQMLPETQFVIDGETGSVSDVRPGRSVSAIGTLDESGALVLARQVAIRTTDAPLLEPQLTVNLDSAQRSFVVSGEHWVPGSLLEVGIGLVGTQAPVRQFSEEGVQVSPDGTFSAPYTFDYSYNTGEGWVIIVTDPATGIYATAPWFAEPPPTPVPTATPPPAPTEGALETPTPESEATGTNTPIVVGGIPGLIDCEPDEFEPDNSPARAKEIFVSFAEGGATQTRNFCPVGDLDLAWFRVKAGRWYRVFTQNLAPGVDTVMQVGDLNFSTPCQPAGCWNDDRASLTFESEVIFRAIEDDSAMITVDNFGSAYGADATYELGVEEFVPEPTPTVTPYPSATASRTPTASVTPKPFRDDCDDGTTQNNTCANACLISFDPVLATIARSTDQDWFESIQLGAGRYTVVLEPPDDTDLDLQVYAPGSPDRSGCPGALLTTSRNPGDEREEILFDVLVAPATVYIRVYPADADQVDQHNPYHLQLFARDATQPPPPTATATFTAAPTSTSTPTLPVPVP